MKKIRIFVDMDGTLNKWRPAASMEDLFTPGFYLTAEPQQNVIDAIKILKEKHEVFVLSAVLSDATFSIAEKNRWLDTFLPEVDKEHRLYADYKAEKAEYVPEGIHTADVLIDDYSKNLHSWREWGGVAVKCINGVNGTKGTWADRPFISAFDTPEQIASSILGVTK